MAYLGLVPSGQSSGDRFSRPVQCASSWRSVARAPLFVVRVVTPSPDLRRYADVAGMRVMNAFPASFLMAN
jgi:hypothetical protein